MEIREIFDTIESDPNMDKDLQNDILEKISNIAKSVSRRTRRKNRGA